MNLSIPNPCIRCGKERLNGRTWKQETKTLLEKSVVTHTETVCPDPECQKIVNERMMLLRQKNEAILQAKEERMRKVQIARKKSH